MLDRKLQEIVDEMVETMRKRPGGNDLDLFLVVSNIPEGNSVCVSSTPLILTDVMTALDSIIGRPTDVEVSAEVVCKECGVRTALDKPDIKARFTCPECGATSPGVGP